MMAAVTYAPATFEERGACVAFTTPLLSQTRVRRDSDCRLEVLIPSFSEGRGIYVVPWRAVPEIVSMTVHDRFLHALIAHEGATTPDGVRRAALRAARKGLAGPGAVESARATLAVEEEDRTITNFLLIVEVLNGAGINASDLIRAGLDSEEGERMTRQSMTRAAERIGIDAAELYRRVADMAEVMCPIGLAQAPRPGRLRGRLTELETFRDTARAWADQDVSDTAPVAAFCAGVATDTLAIGKLLLGEFDRCAAGAGVIVREWDRHIGVVRRTAERLAWLVDGWDFLTTAWRDALERTPQDQRMTMNELFRILPLIPRSESRYAHAAGADDVLVKHRRSVRAYEDWRTGQVDSELIRRIETIKIKAGSPVKGTA